MLSEPSSAHKRPPAFWVELEGPEGLGGRGREGGRKGEIGKRCVRREDRREMRGESRMVVQGVRRKRKGGPERRVR